MHMKNIIEMLEHIDGAPLFKNSLSYDSREWVTADKLTVKHPVQRKLTDRECVFDFDGVGDMHFEVIPALLTELGIKYIAWKSGPMGMHIHFWTQVVGDIEKKAVVKYLATKIEEVYGIRNDLGPMGHGFIRAEYSFHPIRGYQKTLLRNTLTELNNINYLPAELLEKIDEIKGEFNQKRGKIAEIDGKRPTCIKYILSHQFSDGRQRMLFILASWFKANGYTPEQNFKLCYNWCEKQKYNISNRKIWAFIHSTSGTVGCTHRHEVLEEIGVDMSKCQYEK